MFSRFFLSITVFEIQGAQKGINTIFWGHIKFLLFIQFWWDFFHWIPLNEGFQNCSADFFYLLPFLRYNGPKCDFGTYIKFLFFIQFWWDFFHWIPLNDSFQNCSADFSYLLPFSRYKGPKRAKMRFLRLHQIFIFHPILMGFFSLDSSQWELSELLQPIFSISYRFRDTRGPKGNVNLLNISL